ncbi:MAG: nucleotidyl transferase AbiEii/AbiGii toxin family protein [Gammaproteobacteria bacterium]|nr:nucleotidyl transferase AbiEii/AbiGii toxin family protein [Gammaproteobacteria bacterium]
MSLYLPLFKALNEADVQYIVVGGIATILHGYVRATADVDLVIDLQADEAKKAITALTSEGFKPKIPVQAIEFADETKREQWIKEKGMQVFALYHPDKPGITVDLFVHHPVPYQPLLDRSVIMDLEGIKVRVCSIDDLIAMKQQAGRQKDLADIEQLTKIKDYEKDRSSE